MLLKVSPLRRGLEVSGILADRDECAEEVDFELNHADEIENLRRARLMIYQPPQEDLNSSVSRFLTYSTCVLLTLTCGLCKTFSLSELTTPQAFFITWQISSKFV